MGMTVAQDRECVDKLVHQLRRVGEPIITVECMANNPDFSYTIRVMFMTPIGDKYIAIEFLSDMIRNHPRRYMKEIYNEILNRIQREFDKENWEERHGKTPASHNVQSVTY